MSITNRMRPDSKPINSQIFYFTIQFTFGSSFQRQVYRGERNSRRIFQSVSIPDEANLTLSSRILELILSKTFMRDRLFAEAGCLK